MTENWEWADDVLERSEYSDFSPDECEFIPETGNHVYTNELGESVAVTPEGKVIEVRE